MLAELGLIAAMHATGASALTVPRARPSIRREAVRLGAGVAVDLGITEWMLATDPRVAEGNPLMGSRGVRLGYAAASTAMSAYAIAELERSGHRGSAGAVRGGLWGQRAAVIGVNVVVAAGGAPSSRASWVAVGTGAVGGALVGWLRAR